jgi:hypothetical protein
METILSDTGITNKDKANSVRIESIDILRAITMLLMIFVNDFWSLKNIPDGLRHVARGVDGIGLSDVIFPAFLFIVGLSLPYAIKNRRQKGDTNSDLFKHILLRTVALITMGVFLVNGESINPEASGIKNWVWGPLSCLCFILIWNSYSKNINKYLVNTLRIAGVLILVFLAFIYRGGESGEVRFETHWWGILGLIGWSYFVSGIITVYSKNNFYVLLAAWLLFCVLSMVNKAGLISDWSVLKIIPGPVKGGTLIGLTMGGVLSSMIFQYYTERDQKQKLTIVFLVLSALLIFLSVITRPYWGLAKLGATPAWLFLCSAITLLAFLFIYWLADVGKKSNWFNLIKPAGTDTLLCYLIPYFIYGAYRLTGFQFPEYLLEGGIGLVKSFVYAMICVFIAGALNRSGIRLKI